MSASVPEDIATRVTTKAESDPFARDRALVAARDARNYLGNVADLAVQDAYLRFTASNNPAAQALRARQLDRPTWSYLAWVLLGGGFVALIAGAVVSSAVAALAFWVLIAAGLGALKYKQRTSKKERYRRQEEALLEANPWPWGAEHVPAHNPHAEHGSTRVETRLLGLAVLITEEIRRSPAWNDPVLDRHAVRIDLDATLTDISQRAYRVWRIRTEAGVPQGDSIYSAALHQQFEEYSEAARAAEHALRDHVTALAEYLGELRPLERMLHDLELLNRASGHGNDDLLRQLHVDATGGRADAVRVRDHATQLRDLSANLDAQFHYLREQVHRSRYLL